MNDTISRQAAIEAVDKYYNDHKYITRSRTTLSAICMDMKNVIKDLLSAQPERKNGKWIVYYECPKCGEITKDFMEYCPFCGADMQEGEK